MNTFSKFAYVAAGGMVGATLRYGAYVLVDSLNVGIDKIWVTAVVNVFGSFVLGCMIGLAQGGNIDERINLLVIVGALGAFTTFSTFAAEGVSLLLSGNGVSFAVYAVVSNLLSLLAAFVGIVLFRSLVGA